MKPSIGRRLSRWMIAALALLVLLGSLLLFLVATQPGARLVVGLIMPKLPGSMTVEKVAGRLVGPLQLEGFRLGIDRVTVTVTRVDLKWRPLRLLLDRRGVIDDLCVVGLRVVIDTASSDSMAAPPVSEEESDSAGVRLPFPIEFARVTVNDAAVSVPGAVLVDEAHGTLTGSTEGFTVEGGGRVSGPSIPQSLVEFAGQGSLEGMTLEGFRAQLLGGSVTVAGDLAWLPRIEWDVSLEADSIAYGGLLSDPEAWPGRASATATTAGDLDGYRLEATVVGTGPRLPPSDIHLAGRGTLGGFVFDEASAEVLGGTGRVNGSVTWSPEVSWHVAVVLDDMHPGPLLPDSTEWPGTVTVHGRTTGRLTDGKPSATILVDSLSGSLRDQPLAGYVEGQLEDRDITLTDTWVTWGAARVSGAGQWADSMSGRFAVDVPDLSDLHPDWAGVLEAHGDVSGRREKFRIEADLTANGIQVDSFRVAHASGHISVEVDSTPGGRVELTLGGLSSGSLVLDSVMIDAEGTSEAHELRALLRTSKGNLSLGLRGALAGGTWSGDLQQLAVAQQDLGEWSLSQAVPMVISDSMASIDSLCLTADGSFLCASGTWHRREPWSASGSIQAFPLAFFQPLLPDSVVIEGTLDGDVQAAVSHDGLLQARVDLTFGAGAIHYLLGKQQRRLDYQPIRLLSTMGPGGLSAETAVTLTLPGGEDFGTIEATLQLPEYRRLADTLASQPLRGSLNARLMDVSLIRALDQEITKATGHAKADLRFEGTVGDPIVVGEARYEDGEIEIPDLGVTLSDILIVAKGDRDGGLAVDGRMRSGEGVLTIAGVSPVVPSVDEPASLTIKGERFQAVNIPEADVVISPDLRLSMTGDSIDLTGTVVVPKAIIELTEVPAQAVPVSDDVVFVDIDPATVRGPVTITSSVRVVLGDSVSFRGFGFSANLEGSFLVVDRPDHATTGTGTITISRGRYRAYGQDLRIDQGRVIFNGPIDNPGLDIQAYREARDRTIAGLNIRGSLQQPEVSVFSNPSMSQSEAMSYIMFGRPLQQGNTSEQNRMSDAATSLGGDMLAQSLGAKVGLEAGIEQGSDPNDAALVAGTYLSPHVFVAYGVGLFERVNIFRVRYEFNRRWSVQAESSQESSADLFFTFERK